MSSGRNKYIGSVVSVYCEDGSCIQGQLVSLDQKNGTFDLKRPFKDGRQMKEPKLSLGLDKVLSIKCLKVNNQCAEEIDAEAKSKEHTNSEDSQKSNSDGQIPHSELDAMSTSVQQTISVSPSPLSNSTPSTPFLNSLKTNGLNRYERWGTKNGYDGKCARYSSSNQKCNGKRGTHGCGDPVLDTENGFWVRKQNRHLLKPLDLETMSTDFDFEGNLALFDKVSVEMEENGDHLRKPTEKNYKHYENVISDPSRVTSWTTAPARCKNDRMNHARYTASRIATTQKGVKIPFLSYEDKQSYLSVAESFLGSEVFYVQTADRLLMFLWAVIDRFEVMVDELVILTSPIANPLLLNRFVQHFSNRACKTVIYGEDSIAVDLPYVRRVKDPRDLPVGDGRFVIALDGQRQNPDLISWADRLPRQTHLICLEQPRNLCVLEHVLMIGVGTDSRDGELPRNKEDGLVCVTDMGIPFTWLDMRSAAYLATAFATEMIVVL